MTKNVSIAIDIGGTFIRSTLLNDKGTIIPDTFAIFSSKSSKDKKEIIENLYNIIKFNINTTMIPEFKVKNIGLAFPGPFDYENGISYIANVDKFDSIYQLNIKAVLMNKLFRFPSVASKLSKDLNIFFDNDARLFAIGEYDLRTEKEKKSRIIYLTIGSGLGSTFIEDGGVIENKYGLPESGWIYSEPFKNGKIDDYISRRGILRLAEDIGLELEEWEPKNIAELAFTGNIKAIKVYRQFGKNLTEMLGQYIESFTPDEIVLGGNISLSYDLFKSDLEKKVKGTEIKIKVIDNTSLNIFNGISKSFNLERNVSQDDL